MSTVLKTRQEINNFFCLPKCEFLNMSIFPFRNAKPSTKERIAVLAQKVSQGLSCEQGDHHYADCCCPCHVRRHFGGDGKSLALILNDMRNTWITTCDCYVW